MKKTMRFDQKLQNNLLVLAVLSDDTVHQLTLSTQSYFSAD